MKAEDFYITNYRSKYNPCFKENRKVEQYTFDDMVEFAETLIRTTKGICFMHCYKLPPFFFSF